MGNLTEIINLNEQEKKITNGLIKFNVLKPISCGEKQYIDYEKIESHLRWENSFIKEYFTDIQFWRLLGHEGDKTKLKSYFKNLLRLQYEGKLKLRILHFPLLSMSNNPEYAQKLRFVRKSEILEILSNYIPFKEAAKLLGISEHHAITRLKELGINKVTFIKRNEFIFFNKKELNRYLFNKNNPLIKEKKYKNVEIINRSEVLRILNINSDIYKKLIDDRLLNVYLKNSRQLFFEKSKVYRFKEKQIKIINDLEQNYYTREDIMKELEINVDAIHCEIRKIEIPYYIKGKTKYRLSKYCYLKKDVQKEVIRRNQRQLFFSDQGTIFNNVIHRLKLLNIDFSQSISLTKRLWLQFIEIRSDLFQSQNERSKSARISDYVNTSRAIAERMLNKEIISCTAQELNMLFFNNITEYTVQVTLYNFLKELLKSTTLVGKVAFRIREIRNPYDLPLQQRVKEIYTVNEYSTLFGYINNLQLHKKNSIKSIRKTLEYFKKNKTIKYDKYDSSWLYLLIHLNNGWRHWDCTEIPRISFNGTSIQDSIDWMENNDISIDDAKKIIKKLQITQYKHSKTGAERYLFCSEQLTLSFANAVVLCEIRTRRLNPMSDTIINFLNKKRIFTQSMHKNFFKYIEENIVFESLKMNRTVLSFAFNLSRELGETAHEGEIIKYLRNHKDINISNIYIILSQDDIFFLSKQIFTREYFGFIPDIFAELLFGSEANLAKRTNQIELINSRVGNYIKLEGISKILNHLLNSEVVVEDIIRNFSKEEIKDKYNRLIMGNLPSKKDDIQCLVSEEGCAYPGKECEMCHFSIPNFFAISSVCEAILIDIESLCNIDNLKFKGDKQRVAILFSKKLRLFKDAFLKFGNVIFDFMDMDMKMFEDTLSKLPSLQRYLQ
jgi:hypothetical protein